MLLLLLKVHWACQQQCAAELEIFTEVQIKQGHTAHVTGQLLQLSHNNC